MPRSAPRETPIGPLPPTRRQVRLASRPVGLPTAADWRHTLGPVVTPGAGGVLVEVLALSLDPAMRGWMNEGRSYGENFGKPVLQVAADPG